MKKVLAALLIIASGKIYAACPAAPVGAPEEPVIQLKRNADGKTSWGATNMFDATEEGAIVWDDANNAVAYCDGASWVTLGSGGAGDNLGDHTATQNIVLGSNYLSGDGGNEGVFVAATGNVGIGTDSPSNTLHVQGAISVNASASDRDFLVQGRSIFYGGAFSEVDTIGGKDMLNNVLVRSTSGRSGVTVELANNYLSGTSDDGFFVAAVPFDGVAGDYKAFRLRAGATLADKFYVNVDGSGFFADSIGVVTESPSSTIHVAGDIQLGNESATCDANKAGAIRYNLGVVEFCNSTAWAAIGDGGANAINDLSDGIVLGGSTYLGTSAGVNDDGSSNKNVGVGFDALATSTVGSTNTAVGHSALKINLNGNANTAIGVNTLVANTSGSYNTALGQAAMFVNTTGNYNTSIGSLSMRFNTIGLGNVAVGRSAMTQNIDGARNIALGMEALAENTGGDNNIGVGYQAGNFYGGSTSNELTSSNGSIFIGYQSMAGANNSANEIVIGHQAEGNGSNSVTLGNDSIATTVLKGNVGIGTKAPSSTLHVAGDIVSQGNDEGAATTIDFSAGNVAYTSASCGAMTLQNMIDGGSYSLVVKGTTSGTCSFSHTGLSFKYPSGHGATEAGKHTVYSFLVAGVDVYVTWIKGY